MALNLWPPQTEKPASKGNVDWLFGIAAFLVVAAFTGWFVAETDNQMLMQQVKEAQHAVAITRNLSCE